MKNKTMGGLSPSTYGKSEKKIFELTDRHNMKGIDLEIRCKCGAYYSINMRVDNTTGPSYCPRCGVEYKYEQTPKSLAQKIKDEFHGDGDEGKMEEMLDELTEMVK